jgi:FdhE protein
MISSIDSTAPDPSVVSNIQTLPFVRLPDPGQRSVGNPLLVGS